MSEKTKMLLMGKIGAAHGIRGQVRITPFTQYADDIAAYGPLGTNRAGLTITIDDLRVQKNIVVARIKGISSREDAEKLNGVELYLDRTLLPENEDEDDFYHADLIGLEARIEDGTVIGEVIALPNFGAGDLIEIRDPRSGDTYLYPFTKAVVPHVRIADGFISIAVPTDADPGQEEPD
ncbi:ribosome maturation factor RimM [Devosia rhodophyticola]|uniref:Ribosome maturation factor RimM n=1 Tax=Devosia rhodophyticola TaxID=3026423 RepID=A0ABY7Z339_9HYPH|nr:ribosome maturation factor RimM [Devosia rhodophyticola]WDR07410.1 ribosome maturation factor RimM [Devosia rhodophyticola]